MKMKNFKRILFFLLFFSALGFLLADTNEKKESHIIQGVPYHPMLDGFCGMTALWMNLDYYGQDIETATLLNLGWSYGFFYWKTPERTWIYPNTGPVEEIVHAANILGFEAKVILHKSVEEAKQTLVGYLSRDIPVIIQWIGHTGLAYGYENGGETVVFHNPDDPGLKLSKDATDPYDDLMAAKRMNIRQWEGPPWLWGVFGYKCVVLSPVQSKPVIDLKTIFKRNAEKTLGILKDSYPAEYGLEGLSKLIQDMEMIQFKENKERVNYLLNFEGLFFLGTGFRREAAAFLAGQASISPNKALSKAAIAFRKSAQHFREGYNLLLKLKTDHLLSTAIHQGYLAILKEIADWEKKGAEALIAAATAR
jgi:hypothetical protein